MKKATITFRTDEDLKENATILFDSMGMTLSTALNLFLKQAVRKQKFPCSLDYTITGSAIQTYKDGFFDLFGTGNNLGFDEEPKELKLDKEEFDL